MQSTQQVDEKGAAAPTCCAPAAKSRWLNSRNVLIGALAVAAGTLYFGWNWLVAAGLASVVLGVLPCLAMCALGLCMGRMGNKEPATPVQTAEKRNESGSI